MEARITNGASVNRMWGRNSEGELVAVFQYHQDAIAFAKEKLAEDAERQASESFYIVSCSYDGKVYAFHHMPPEKSGAA